MTQEALGLEISEHPASAIVLSARAQPVSDVYTCGEELRTRCQRMLGLAKPAARYQVSNKAHLLYAWPEGAGLCH